jgi:uncharacterized protein (DUF433 family)
MATSTPVSLRIPDEVRQEIQDTVQRTGRDFSSVANELLLEGVRMRRIPGIVFADGPAGRRARVAGTGIEVFEVVRDWQNLGQDWDELRATYHWLAETQLRAALAYYAAYPTEVDERLRLENEMTPEVVWTKYPFTKPRWRS